MFELSELHPRVKQDVDTRLSFIEYRGSIDFGREAPKLLAHVLELDDALPAKAVALADLAALALWYADELRKEQG